MKKRDRIEPLALKKLKTGSLKERKSLVGAGDLGRPHRPGASFGEFLETLPDILAAKDLMAVKSKMVDAARNRREVVLAMGAHPVKVGLSPVIIDLMERGVVTALAMNGAGIIHDFEMAFTGATSEDVSETIGKGDFGTAKETAEFLNHAVSLGHKEGLGLGRAVGRAMGRESLPHKELSLLAACERLGVPVTVHVALGTDIIHIHPSLDPDAVGGASHLDFRIFASIIANLAGGVFINMGSAVIMPEVFLKALTLARNIGHEVEDFTAVNLDFALHYRPLTNVVTRPVARGGLGVSIVGHHEITFPLLAAAVVEELGDEKD